MQTLQDKAGVKKGTGMLTTWMPFLRRGNGVGRKDFYRSLIFCVSMFSFKGPYYNTVPPSDLQQWAAWQLHGRKSSERVAFVTWEAAEGKVNILMQFRYGCYRVKPAHHQRYFAYNKLSKHTVEFRETVNIWVTYKYNTTSEAKCVVALLY